MRSRKHCMHLMAGTSNGMSESTACYVLIVYSLISTGQWAYMWFRCMQYLISDAWCLFDLIDYLVVALDVRCHLRFKLMLYVNSVHGNVWFQSMGWGIMSDFSFLVMMSDCIPWSLWCHCYDWFNFMWHICFLNACNIRFHFYQIC